MMQEEFEALPLEELWAMYKAVDATLSEKMDAEARAIQERLDTLRVRVKVVQSQKKARPA